MHHIFFLACVLVLSYKTHNNNIEYYLYALTLIHPQSIVIRSTSVSRCSKPAANRYSNPRINWG